MYEAELHVDVVLSVIQTMAPHQPAVFTTTPHAALISSLGFSLDIF